MACQRRAVNPRIGTTNAQAVNIDARSRIAVASDHGAPPRLSRPAAGPEQALEVAHIPATRRARHDVVDFAGGASAAGAVWVIREPDDPLGGPRSPEPVAPLGSLAVALDPAHVFAPMSMPMQQELVGTFVQLRDH
jgi:hypothetical protein